MAAFDPGGGGFPAPSLVTLLLMYLDGGFNPFDAMVLAVQSYANFVWQTIGDGPVEVGR